MSKTVPMRIMEVFQTDDGRRIEKFKLYKNINYEVPEDADNQNPEVEFVSKDDIYIGVVHIMTKIGPKEIKFEIPEAKDIEDAFDKYYKLANEAVEEIKKRWEEQQKQEESQIVTASAGDLDAIDAIEQESGNIIV